MWDRSILRSVRHRARSAFPDLGFVLGGADRCPALTVGGRDTRRVCPRGLPLGWIVALSLLICALSAAQAYAFTHRGHVFGFSFAGNGEGAFGKPGGVAVDEASGDVYVVDSAHERVERFTPNGKGDYTFVSAFKVDSPGAVAVDNTAGSASAGDVYVVGSVEAGAEAAERDYLYKFTAAGEKIFRKSMFKAKEGKEPVEPLELEDIQSVAVEPDGTLWVYWGEEGRLAGFDDSEVNGWVPSLTPAEFEGAESGSQSASRGLTSPWRRAPRRSMSAMNARTLAKNAPAPKAARPTRFWWPSSTARERPC